MAQSSSPPSTPFHSIIGIVIATLVILVIFMLLGMRYPVVGRGDTVPGIPNLLILLGALLSVLYSAAIVVLTSTRCETPAKLVTPLLGYFLTGVILITGCLMFINGAFDRSTPQLRQIVVLNKYTHQARGTDYFLIAQDWYNPTQTIRLRVSPTIYQQSAISQPINVTTASGSLGFERIVSVQ